MRYEGELIKVGAYKRDQWWHACLIPGYTLREVLPAPEGQKPNSHRGVWVYGFNKIPAYVPNFLHIPTMRPKRTRDVIMVRKKVMVRTKMRRMRRK